MNFTARFAEQYRKVLPTPLTIAVILTLLTFILALIFTRPDDSGLGDYTVTLLKGWEAGLWNDGPGGLEFAFQMMLMLVLGHVMALSGPFDRLANHVLSYCHSTATAALMVALVAMTTAWMNWGLGLVFGAILARKVGEKFANSSTPLNYGLIGAAAYAGLMIWHGGLSGSAPLKANEQDKLASLFQGGQLPEGLPDHIASSDTLFGPMNLTLTVILLIAIPTLLYYIGKKNPGAILDKARLGSSVELTEEDTQSAVGAEKLDLSRIFGMLLGLAVLFVAFSKAFLWPEEISLAVVTPNFINLCLLGCSLLLHRSIMNFLKATDQAISGAAGILIQFPLYFGILALMSTSGLVGLISDWMVDISNETTLPLMTFFSAGLVNIFVPSGGGQWAIQGPIVLTAAQEMGVSLPKTVMALSYGDQLTNMLQPFWALPLLGITGLKAKEILPYTLIIMMAGLAIFVIGLLSF